MNNHENFLGFCKERCFLGTPDMRLAKKRSCSLYKYRGMP